jgi:hypothetical protein
MTSTLTAIEPLWRARLRTLEAMAALSAAYLLVRVVPFVVFRAISGRVEHSTPDHETDAEPTEPAAVAVARALRRGAARLPLPSSCLIKAVAARLMLMRRRMPSILVLGVSRRDGQTRAHAWLLGGGGVVCGGDEAAEFSPIAAFHHATSR